MKIGDIAAYILINGRRATEYQIHVSEQHHTAHCWIESKTGQAFTIKLIDHRKPRPSTRVACTLDGVLADVGDIICPDTEKYAKRTRNTVELSHLEISKDDCWELCFKEVNPVDEPDRVDGTSAEKLGCIEVRLYHIRITKEYDSDDSDVDTEYPSFEEHNTISETLTKNVNHCIGLGKKITPDNESQRLKLKSHDLKAHPIYMWTFYYEPSDALIANGRKQARVRRQANEEPEQPLRRSSSVPPDAVKLEDSEKPNVELAVNCSPVPHVPSPAPPPLSEREEPRADVVAQRYPSLSSSIKSESFGDNNAVASMDYDPPSREQLPISSEAEFTQLQVKDEAESSVPAIRLPRPNAKTGPAESSAIRSINMKQHASPPLPRPIRQLKRNRISCAPITEDTLQGQMANALPAFIRGAEYGSHSLGAFFQQGTAELTSGHSQNNRSWTLWDRCYAFAGDVQQSGRVADGSELCIALDTFSNEYYHLRFESRQSNVKLQDKRESEPLDIDTWQSESVQAARKRAKLGRIKNYSPPPEDAMIIEVDSD